MVCYVIPLTAAILHYVFRKTIPFWKNNKYHSWLSLLMVGGAIFGLVDHLWNGELFLIGKNPMFDIMLGLTITLAILAVWTITVVVDKITIKKSVKTIN